MKRRIITTTALMVLLSLLSACLPWQIGENEGTELSASDMNIVLSLFEDLTDESFIDYLASASDFHITGSDVKASAALEDYGASDATGMLEISFSGTRTDSSIICDEYVMDGTVAIDGETIIIEGAEGKADGIVFSLFPSPLLSSTARLRYPTDGKIQLDGKEGMFVMIFPENSPFEEALSADEQESIRTLVYKAFSVFPVMKEGMETKAFSGGTATLEASSEDEWSMNIWGEADGVVIAIEISSGSDSAAIIYGDRNISMDKSSILKGLMIPQFENDADETLMRTYLDKMRESNLVFALRGLINGSSSGVIELKDIALQVDGFTAYLALDRYGLKNDMRVSGNLILMLSGKMNDGRIEAEAYKASSASLTFTGLEDDMTISLEDIEGKLEGENPVFILENADGTYEASYSGNLILGFPESGMARCEDLTIQF